MALEDSQLEFTMSGSTALQCRLCRAPPSLRGFWAMQALLCKRPASSLIAARKDNLFCLPTPNSAGPGDWRTESSGLRPAGVL